MFFSLISSFLSRKIFSILILLLIGLSLTAQNLTDAELKTVLVYNFLKLTETPRYAKQDTLTLGVFGDDKAMLSSLEKLNNRKTEGKIIQVSYLDKALHLSGIDVLFVLNENNFELTRIIKLLKNKEILLITDRVENKEQVMLNFYHAENNKVQFEVNTKEIQKANFTISPKLLLLGGTEIDIRELYTETEKTLVDEKERSLQIQQELDAKEKEVSKLSMELISLNTRIDSLNSIIIFQINNIHQQQSNLNKLNHELSNLAFEATLRKHALDSMNISVKDKNRQISELDNDLSDKKLGLSVAAESLNRLKKEIIEKEGVLNAQSNKIESQNITIVFFTGFLVLLVALMYVIFYNYKSKKRKNEELERQYEQINYQKEQIEFQAEELLMTNLELEKLSIVAEKTDNSVIIMNKVGDIQWVNEGFERLQESQLNEFIEKNGQNFIQSSSNNNAKKLLLKCSEEKLSVTYNSSIKTKSNQIKWLQSTLTPILNDNNEVDKIVAIDTDITRLKNAEAKVLKKNVEIEEKARILRVQTENLSEANTELEKQKKRAEKALQKLQNTQSQLVAAEKMASLGQLTSGIAHEINNPINYISSSIEGLIYILNDIKQLMNAYDSFEQIKESPLILKLKEELEYNELLLGFDELTGNIKMGVDRAKEIVNSLRVFSRIDEDNYSKLDLKESINSAIVLLGKQHKDNISISTQFDDLPDIECIAGKINQVFLNVLVNAIQSINGKGEVSISTSIEEKNNKKYARIDFKDTGSGIPDEVKEKIFDPFYTTKDVGQGTGLGLSITYSIIKKHNGFIEIDSKLGKGTTFSFYLPLKRD